MGNIRQKYKVEPKKKEEKKKIEPTGCDVAAYPFGAEEMLLNAELKELDER